MNTELSHIRSLPNTELLEQTSSLVTEERRIGVAILKRLAEISRRLLFLELGYSSMFKYCTLHLKYPEANACRLLDSMTLLLEIPEIESKIASGVLSVSSVSQVQSFARAQLKAHGLTLSVQDKKSILAAVEGLSKKGTEKVLATLYPQHPLPEDRESERMINASETEIMFLANEELLNKLKRIEDLMAHTNWNPTYAELIDQMAEIVLDKIDPVRVQERMDRRKNKVLSHQTSPSSAPDTRPQQSPPPVEVKQSRYIQPKTIRAVWIEAGSQCTYTCSTTGTRCTETKGLQMEHLMPWGMGGSNDKANLTLRCFRHNALSAIHVYGASKMSPFLGNTSSVSC